MQIVTWMSGRESLADNEILPLVRRFAFVEKDWFDGQQSPTFQAWSEGLMVSTSLAAIMERHQLSRTAIGRRFFRPLRQRSKLK
jgi:glutathione S-transferase